VIAGLSPSPARALAAAGYRSLCDLEGVTRETLLAIPGLGHPSVATIARLFDHPLPGRPVPRCGPPPYQDTLWRRRGLPTSAAITFAQVNITLRRLAAMTREELLALDGVGPRALQACELLLGRPIPSRTPTNGVAIWLRHGIPSMAARALHQAGLHTPADLKTQTRDDLLALRGIGPLTLARLEDLLGREIPSRAAGWLAQGLAVPIANALVRAGLHTLADLEHLSREQFLSLRGLGRYALTQCQKLLGHRLPSERAPVP